MKFGQGELLPVCSILGGVMSQEVLKVLSGKDRPIYNIFCMDAIQSKPTTN
jgi:ubiquitin-like 1-activating enzyme E1 A